MRNGSAKFIVALAALGALACAPELPFCSMALTCEGEACAQPPSEGDCISLEEAAALAEDASSGVHSLRIRVEPAMYGFINAYEQNTNAICAEDVCYLKGNGAVRLHTSATTQTRFQHWSGCDTTAEPDVEVGGLQRDGECVANYAPGHADAPQ